jgi:toxin YoeB
MKKYYLRLSDEAKDDIKYYKKSGNKSIVKKINDLLDELKEHPKTGTGKPEQLKGFPNRWSRRITDKHRLVYRIQEDIVVVLVVSAHGHYNDK